MKVLFDTSVLVAAMVEAHPRHRASLAVLQKAMDGKIKMFVAAHSCAEVYAVLTTLPVSPRIIPETAVLLLEKNILPWAKVVDLSAQDYVDLIHEIGRAGLSGGVVYDAIAIHCARKAHVDHIWTWNSKDFIRIAQDLKDKICEPEK